MFASRPVWSSAVFVGENPLQRAWKLPTENPKILMNTKGLKLASDAVHTIADPFVFTANDGNDLYLFAEEQRRRRPGRIRAWQILDDLAVTDMGELNFGEGHLSYPFVIEHRDSIFIIPETSSLDCLAGQGEVALYRFVKFPTCVEKVAILLRGPYVDSSIFIAGGYFYLFTFLDGDGLLFVSEQIEGPYVRHRDSPISTDNRNARCGGAVIAPTQDRPFAIRPGQDCSIAYGGDLTLMKITKLTPDEYAEEMWARNLITGHFTWAATGAHHISQCIWKDQVVTAVDGQQRDYLLNRFLGVLAR